jgi:SAM-dependent methyltransferase
MPEDTLLDKRQFGSAADFDQDWTEALSQDGGRWLIYPTTQPVKQFDLFEQVKAQEVDAVLAAHHLDQGLVLEYGCGAAGMSVYLANHGFRAVACDISVNALHLAQLNMDRHLASGSTDSVHVAAGDVLQLPFADASFDVVMSYGLLEHFAPEIVDVVLAEVVRTLRPGGLFIADIAHRRFSVRTLGMWLSLIGSLAYHAATLRWQRLPSMTGAYLDALYENDLDNKAWSGALQRAGLQDVQVRICHPFPPLALSGRPERAYVALMQQLLPMWRRFHRDQPAWARWWGWLYLVWGVK